MHSYVKKRVCYRAWAVQLTCSGGCTVITGTPVNAEQFAAMVARMPMGHRVEAYYPIGQALTPNGKPLPFPVDADPCSLQAAA